MTSIAIIDYGMGNLHSIAKALEHVASKERVIVSSQPAQILAADRVVFPGVGAIRDCMAELMRSGLNEVVLQAAATKPLLGVCLGMQALLNISEENQGTECLGIIPGKVVRFPEELQEGAEGSRLKIPHMGWNQVHQQCSHSMWTDIPAGSRFYFVHSYYAVPERVTDIAAVTPYGIDFASVLAHENIFAVQFHPEKSQHAGLQLLSNFVHWNGDI
ncbi:MAG: imidazole glycerol phosphate synthase subunit HisH [Gammaproteobacteria bacterium]|jgi:glutamine amidotransferase|nr:imidazole glycerol phosphate synthase subunit HisH [Gammaproteobacteria bacterium]